MAEQQIDRERRAMWRQIATDAGDDPYANTLHPDEVLALLDALEQAEARIKAVRDLCDDADKRHASVLIVTTVRRALDG